jgi:hypothetical protein
MTRLDHCATAIRPRWGARVLRDSRMPMGVASADSDAFAQCIFARRGRVGGMETMRLRASVTGGDP